MKLAFVELPFDYLEIGIKACSDRPWKVERSGFVVFGIGQLNNIRIFSSAPRIKR